MKKVFLFSGQGSQYYQMGQELYAQNSVFKKWLDLGEALFRAETKRSLLNEIFGHSRKDIFSKTLFTHPAIYLMEYALARTLRSMGIIEDVLWGYSLGEFTCFALADVFSFEDGFNLVFKQAQFIETHCPVSGMLVVLDSPEIFKSELFSGTYLAGINLEKHFAVSGTTEQLNRIGSTLKNRNIATMLLPVSCAFHSPLMQLAKQPFLQFFQELKIKFEKPQKMIYSSLKARYLLDSDLNVEHLWDATALPIYFDLAFKNIEKQGPWDYLDVGPSGTLATFIKHLKQPNSLSQAQMLLSPFGKSIEILKELVRV